MRGGKNVEVSKRGERGIRKGLGYTRPVREDNVILIRCPQKQHAHGWAAMWDPQMHLFGGRRRMANGARLRAGRGAMREALTGLTYRVDLQG